SEPGAREGARQRLHHDDELGVVFGGQRRKAGNLSALPPFASADETARIIVIAVVPYDQMLRPALRAKAVVERFAAHPHVVFGKPPVVIPDKPELALKLGVDRGPGTA